MKDDPKTPPAGAGERLQKVLAKAGLASRRAAEELIVAGRVRVDGRVVTELGTRVDRRARIEVDGKRIAAEHLVYIVLHKPRGVVCTLSDPQGRPTVAELIRGVGTRVVPVGRLDFHTSGALLMTNDGDFSAVLTHPRHHVPKVYVAKVRGVVDERGLAELKRSIDIDGIPTRPADVKILRVEGDKTWLEVVLQEGKNRQVRRLGDAAGHPVMRLVRTEHAGISSEGLRPGEWRPLGATELAELKKAFGVPKRIHAPQFEAGAGREEEYEKSTLGARHGAGKRKAARPPARQRDEGPPARERKPAGAKPQRGRPQRAESQHAKPQRGESRPERERSAARGGRVSARGGRESSRRRGT